MVRARVVDAGEFANAMKRLGLGLTRGLTKISVSGPACVGGFCGPLLQGVGFAGRIAIVEVYGNAMSAEDARCLFSHGGGRYCRHFLIGSNFLCLRASLFLFKRRVV